MLTALPVIVGRECVTGVIAPMTPNGAYSMTAKPWSPLNTSLRMNSTPGDRSPRIFSFSILWGRRPIFVSLNSIVPSSTASSIEIRRMWAIARRRPSTPRRSSWRKASWAARTASSTLAKMPWRPTNDAGATGAGGAGGVQGTVAGASGAGEGAPLAAGAAARNSAITWRTMLWISVEQGAVAWAMVGLTFPGRYGKRRSSPRCGRCRPSR